jgi:octaprenyl-diphosphate synthase
MTISMGVKTGLDLGAIALEMRQVEEEIARSVSSQSPVLREVAVYMLSSGGKRIRPAMGIAGFGAAGGKDMGKVIPLAAAVEIIHTSTLLHDDVMDRSDIRRGRPSAHRKYGIQAAIVTGDFLFSRAFSLCARYGPDVIGITSDACRELAEAEMLQATPWQQLDEELCITIAGTKTGSLMGAGMEVAAVVAGADQDTRARLRGYGHSVGTAFQIIDDCLDFSLDGSSGKPSGGDILGGKATLPVVHALAHAPERDKKKIEAFLTSSTEKGALADLVGILERTGSFDHARARAAEFSRAAAEQLSPLKDSVYKDILGDILRFVLERKS